MDGPRIAPLSTEELDDGLRRLLRGGPGGDERPLNIFATLARHPDLYRAWLPFGGELLLRGRLPARDRELAILRTAHRCASEYERAQHLRIGREAGLDDAEMAAAARPLHEHGWTPAERAVLTAVDELHADAVVSDATWQALAGVYDEQQLIELVLLIGQYHMVAFMLNSLGVEVEPDLA